MSETYSSKRERWQRMQQALPAGLREHISLRNVEAVASLTPSAQKRLAQAIQAGLKRLPAAIEQLKADPDTSVEVLLDPAMRLSMNPVIPNHIQKDIADLIQSNFPDMPRISAEALAGSDAMQEVRAAAWANERLLRSTHIRTDFVLFVSMAHLCKVAGLLDEIADKSPAFRAAYKRMELNSKSEPRRKRNA